MTSPGILSNLNLTDCTPMIHRLVKYKYLELQRLRGMKGAETVLSSNKETFNVDVDKLPTSKS